MLQPGGTILPVWIYRLYRQLEQTSGAIYSPVKEALVFRRSSPHQRLLSSLLLALSKSLFLRLYHFKLTLLHCLNSPSPIFPDSCLRFCYLDSHCMDSRDHAHSSTTENLLYREKTHTQLLTFLKHSAGSGLHYQEAEGHFDPDIGDRGPMDQLMAELYFSSS